MHEITNSMSNDSSLSLALFPAFNANTVGGSQKEKGLEFVLPRKGKTILVRAPKTKKILHKFTWTGESLRKKNDGHRDCSCRETQMLAELHPAL